MHENIVVHVNIDTVREKRQDIIIQRTFSQTQQKHTQIVVQV